jgi:hypothetical protein
MALDKVGNIQEQNAFCDLDALEIAYEEAIEEDNLFENDALNNKSADNKPVDSRLPLANIFAFAGTKLEVKLPKISKFFIETTQDVLKSTQNALKSTQEAGKSLLLSFQKAAPSFKELVLKPKSINEDSTARPSSLASRPRGFTLSFDNKAQLEKVRYAKEHQFLSFDRLLRGLSQGKESAEQYQKSHQNWYNRITRSKAIKLELRPPWISEEK